MGEKLTDLNVAAETAIRLAVLAWIKEDAPLAAKVNLMPRHVDALRDRLRAALSHQGEGSGDA